MTPGIKSAIENYITEIENTNLVIYDTNDDIDRLLKKLLAIPEKDETFIVVVCSIVVVSLQSILAMKPYLMYFSLDGNAAFWFQGKPKNPEIGKTASTTPQGVKLFLKHMGVDEAGYYIYRKKMKKMKLFHVQ